MTRKPWLAAVLTLWMPGLGQIYAGALERGAMICCVWWAALFAIFAITSQLPAWIGAWAPFALLITGLTVIMFDASRTARKAPRPFVLQSYNRWYIYLTMPFFFGTPVSVPLKTLINRNFYEAFSIPSDIMAPTIQSGDVIYAVPWRGTVTRGAIVAIRHGGILVLKRVVGIPGDFLLMRNDSLYVNGQYVSEPYATPSYQGTDADGTPTRSTWGPVTVPPHACFVLGDNRGMSRDSRDYGSLPLDSIIKRPIGIYFSIDPETHDVRWSRIGRDIRR